MIYVFESGSVVYDGNTISEEQRNQAVVVENLPIPETPKGKIAILKANKAEERVYYEYIDKPKDTLEDEIENLKQVVADLTELVLLGGI